MKYTYDTNGLRNAMLYTLQKAAIDAGFDSKDFKPITIKVKKITRPVMFDATLNFQIVKEGYVSSNVYNRDTECDFTFYDIPVNKDIEKDCFTKGIYFTYYKQLVEKLKNFVSSDELSSVEDKIDAFEIEVEKVAAELGKKYNCGIEVNFYETATGLRAETYVSACISKLKVDKYTLRKEDKNIKGLYLTIKTATGRDKTIILGTGGFNGSYTVDQLDNVRSDLEEYISNSIINFSKEVKQITSIVDNINSNWDKVATLCDDIEALCEANGYESTCSLNAQYYVHDGKPGFNLSVYIKHLGTENYYIPYDSVDKKCKVILKDIDNITSTTSRSSKSDTITF